jgi:hypothetical protein
MTTPDLRTVNAYRMRAAREAAGLSVRQIAKHFDIDVRAGEYCGQMPAADLKYIRDLYQARVGWLEEEGPVNSPENPWTIVEMTPACSLCERCESRFYRLGPLVICWRCVFVARGRKRIRPESSPH